MCRNLVEGSRFREGIFLRNKPANKKAVHRQARGLPMAMAPEIFAAC